MILIVREPLKSVLIECRLKEVLFIVLLQLNQVRTEKYDGQSGCLREVRKKTLPA